MSIRFRPVKKKNPAKPGEPELFFPCPVSKDKITTQKLAKIIASRTSLSSTDVVAVLDACTSAIPDCLSDGFIVSLGDFGSFRVSLKGEGTATRKEMTESDVKKIRVHFRPGKEFASLVRFAKLEKEEE